METFSRVFHHFLLGSVHMRVRVNDGTDGDGVTVAVQVHACPGWSLAAAVWLVHHHHDHVAMRVMIFCMHTSDKLPRYQTHTM
jgi:hypothetical protein